MSEELLKNAETLPSLKDAEALTIAEAARDILDAKKAKDIAILHVADRSDITDYLVLATGNAAPHVKSLADELEFRLGERELYPLHTDGLHTHTWRILDYGTVMVHIFDQTTREFYHLDKLYKEPMADAVTATEPTEK